MKRIKMNHIYCILLTHLSMVCLQQAFAQTTQTDTVANTPPPLTYIAYGVQPSWMVSSAVSSVGGDDLRKLFTSNVTNTLPGRLPGLTVQQGSGEPGYDSPSLHARGLNTYGSGRGLLILVDGFESPIEQLIPEEIASISLLKDAAATAIFGQRGANGVLLVTTKRGEIEPLTVNFSAQQGVTSALRLPTFLNAYDYARFYNEALVNDGRPILYSNEDLEAYRVGSDPYLFPDINWHDQVLRKNAPIGNYQLHLKGGDQRVKYFVLLNALHNHGLYRNTGDISENSVNSTYNRYNFRTNVDVNITKRLSATLLLGGSVEDKANPASRDTWPLFDLMASVPPNAFPVHNPNGTFGGSQLYSNPLGNVLETGFHTSNGRTLQAVFKLTEQLDMITPGLSVSAAISFNSFFRSYSAKTKQYARYAISGNNPNEISYNQIGLNTSLEGDESQSDQWRNTIFQSFLEYSRNFGLHGLQALLMYHTDTYTISGNNPPYQNRGVGGRLTYINNDKYIGEFSFAYNGSENFPKGNQFGFFPAVSVGWVASNERFLRDNKFLSYLKVRGSYGLTGNNDIGGQRFMFNQYYQWSAPYFFGTSNSERGGITEGPIANPDVTWEKEHKMNIGLEARLGQNLDVSLDYFMQKRHDILASPYRTIPQFVGANLNNLNYGKVNNQGFEAWVNYHSSPSKAFQYSIGASAWYAKNKVAYNAEALQVNEYLYSTNRTIDQPFVLEAIGLFRDQADIDQSAKQVFATVQPGDIKYKDQNQDGIIDENDYFPIGNSTLPELTVSLHPGIQYKGVDLTTFFQAATNRTVYLSGNYFYAFQNNGKVSTIALDRWTSATAETATYPRLSANNNLNNFQPSSFWQRDGSFIKLRSIELGYTLPVALAEQLRLDKARVFINGTNLFSIDHVTYSDPETLTGYPAVRTVSIGAMITF